ncbi:MAG: methylenetetrahydrofolate reductase [Actinomycetota bacterium]
MSEPTGRLAGLLRAGAFAVTSEVVPPLAASGDRIAAAGRGLVGYVDAVNVTDNPVASARMSPLAGARSVADVGLEPTLQLTVRDRNRLAVTADLLGGWALGARNLLCLTGDPLSVGDHPDAVAVGDLTVHDLVRLARRLRDQGMGLAGTEVADPPRYLIGVADMPLADPYDPARLEAKLDAGADAIWTQIAYDIDAIADWIDILRPRGIFERARALIGLVPLRSAKQARSLEDLPGVKVPKEVLQRLDAAVEHGAEAEGAEGMAISIELVQALRGMDDVSGVHLMGLGRDDLVRAVVEAAGLFPRPTDP